MIYNDISHWKIIRKAYAKFTKLCSFNSWGYGQFPSISKLFISIIISRKKASEEVISRGSVLG